MSHTRELEPGRSVFENIGNFTCSSGSARDGLKFRVVGWLLDRETEHPALNPLKAIELPMSQKTAINLTLALIGEFKKRGIDLSSEVYEANVR
jgi:hypothetical protein